MASSDLHDYYDNTGTQAPNPICWCSVTINSILKHWLKLADDLECLMPPFYWPRLQEITIKTAKDTVVITRHEIHMLMTLANRMFWRDLSQLMIFNLLGFHFPVQAAVFLSSCFFAIHCICWHNVTYTMKKWRQTLKQIITTFFKTDWA